MEKCKRGKPDSRELGRAKEGMNQPIFSNPSLSLLCNCSEFSGFLNSMTFSYIIGSSFCWNTCLPWVELDETLTTDSVTDLSYFPCFDGSLCPGNQDPSEGQEPFKHPAHPIYATAIPQKLADPRMNDLSRTVSPISLWDVCLDPLFLTHLIY